MSMSVKLFVLEQPGRIGSQSDFTSEESEAKVILRRKNRKPKSFYVGRIGSQSHFTFAAVWITTSFFRNAFLKRKNCVASDVFRQLKHKQLGVFILCLMLKFVYVLLRVCEAIQVL